MSTTSGEAGDGRAGEGTERKGLRHLPLLELSVRLRVFEHEIPGIEYFDGTLVSAEEKLAEAESGDL